MDFFIGLANRSARLRLRRASCRETRRGLIERLILLGDAEPHDGELRRLGIEGREWNRGHPRLGQRPLRELQVTARQQPAEIEQLKERALGGRQREARAGERIAQAVAFRLEEGGQLAPGLRPLGQVCGDGMLQRVRDAERVELVDLAQLARERRRRDTVADAQPRRMQGLAEGKDCEASLSQLRMRQHRSMHPAVEDHVLIDLIREHDDVAPRMIAASASRSSAVAAVQAGLCGMLNRISRVRGVTAARTRSQS